MTSGGRLTPRLVVHELVPMSVLGSIETFLRQMGIKVCHKDREIGLGASLKNLAMERLEAGRGGERH